MKIAMLLKDLPVGTLLYAHPPRREWRGLTEEEIERITSNLMTSGDGYLRFSVSLLDFARAIEAALKEKNHE